MTIRSSQQDMFGTIETPLMASIQLSQNNPNPFDESTNVLLTVKEEGDVTLSITDVNGRIVETSPGTSLQRGIHQFRVTLAHPGTYVMTANQNGKTSSIKMVCNGGGKADKIDIQGFVAEIHDTDRPKSHSQNLGDQMEYVGYAIIDGAEVESQTIAQTQKFSQTLTFQFVKNQEIKDGTPSGEKSEDFRVALSLSPFSLNQFEKGYSFAVGDKTASTPEELQEIYRELGSTEMCPHRHQTPRDRRGCHRRRT